MTIVFDCSARNDIDVRIKGLGKNSEDLDFSTFVNHLGYQIHVDGDDLILRSNEINNKNRYASTFSIPISIRDKDLLAKTIMDGLSAPFEGQYRQPSFEKLNHFPAYGITAELYKKQYEFYAYPRNQLSSFIKDDLLPFMEKEFQTESALVSSLDANYVQAAISFFKFVYLTNSVGKEQAKTHIQTGRATDAIVPMSLDYQKYANSVLVCLPISSVIEFERPGLILYFTKTSPWFFPYIATVNLFDHLVRSSEPIVGKHAADIRMLVAVLRGNANQKYVHSSLNIFSSFIDKLLDPRTYVDAEGSFSSESAFLVNSAFRLLFHEISDIATSNSRYMRQRVALLSLDKISNIIGAIGNSKRSEVDIFNMLFDRYSERLICAELGKVGESLSRKHSGAFQRFGHACFQKLRVTGKDGSDRPSEEIRAFRNLNHGIFLRSEGFKKIFVTGGGTVPDEICWFPYIYVLAIVNNPGLLKSLGSR